MMNMCVFPALYVLLQRMGCKEEASAGVLEHQRTAGVARLVLGAAVTMLPVLTFGASQAILSCHWSIHCNTELSLVNTLQY